EAYRRVISALSRRMKPKALEVVLDILSAEAELARSSNVVPLRGPFRRDDARQAYGEALERVLALIEGVRS
ncbi:MULTISPECIES: hypothetical protein, partial [unclassified Brevundimonas]